MFKTKQQPSYSEVSRLLQKSKTHPVRETAQEGLLNIQSIDNHYQLAANPQT